MNQSGTGGTPVFLMEDVAAPVSVAPNTAEPAVPREADALRLFLEGRDTSCTRCGYNLRDLSGDNCPECGGRLVLRLNTAEPSMAAVIAGLIGLSMGTGVCLVSFLADAYWSLQPRFEGAGVSGWEVVAEAVVAFYGALAIFLWVHNWRWLQRRPWPLRCALAIACWICAVAAVSCLLRWG